MNKIALLTSSRADYSIYYPLICKIQNSKEIDLDIITFGNHNSLLHGNSSQNILNDGFKLNYKINSLVIGDSPESISDSMGLTITKFSSLWKDEKYKLILCLGDRYEMFSSVVSSIPFNIPIAHISGGETTLGAIDNVFRNCLTIMSKYHFVSTEQYKKQVIKLVGDENQKNVFNVGALSIDNLTGMSFLTIDEFMQKFNIDLNKRSILITFHPETVSFKKNIEYTNELFSACAELKEYQLIFTMPNSDTMGDFIRTKLIDFVNQNKNAVSVESFGTVGYLSCMKHCEFMLGNTSSGFVEASYFPKHVINIGERQKGRIITSNIVNIPIDKVDILKAVKKIESKPIPSKNNLYGDGNSSEKILEILKKILST